MYIIASITKLKVIYLLHKFHISLHFIYEFIHTKARNDSSRSEQRLSVIISDAAEKMRSTGTEVAKMEKTSLAILDKFG